MKAVKVGISGFEKTIKGLKELERTLDSIMEELAKELALRLLAKVKKRTPVGTKPFDKTVAKTVKIKTKKGIRSYLTKEGAILQQYWSGYSGGNLRRSWAIGEVRKKNNIYTVEVINPVEYASYVEYGHRQQPGRYIPQLGKRLKNAWVDGKFMLTISENEIKELAPKLLEKRLKDILKGVFND